LRLDQESRYSPLLVYGFRILRLSVSGHIGRFMPEPSLSRCSQVQSCALWRILETTRNLAAPLGVDEILQKTLSTALEVLNADRGSVFLFDPKSQELYLKVAAGLRSEEPGAGFESVVDSSTSPAIRFPIDRGLPVKRPRSAG